MTSKQRLRSLLRTSEKFTKTDMVYLTSGGFWLTLQKVIVAFAGFGLSVAFANLLPKEFYGNYKYLLSTVAILSAISLTGFGITLTRAGSRGFDGELKRAFWLNMRWSIFMALGAVAIAIYYLAHGATVLGISFLIAGAFSPLIGSASLYSAFLSGKKEFKAVAFLGIVRNLVPAISIFVALLVTQELIPLVTVYFLSHAATATFLYITVARRYVRNNAFEPGSVEVSKHLSFINVLNAISGKIDSVLIFQNMGGTQLAIYSFAAAIPDQLRNLIGTIHALALPKFAARERFELKKAVISKTFKLFILTAGVTVLYVGICPFLFSFFFPQYLESIRFSQAYAVTILFSALLAGTYFDSQNAVRERYIMNVSSAVFQITSIIVLMFLYGLWGIIIARIISAIFKTLVALTLVKYS